MNDIKKIVQALEHSNILQVVIRTSKNETKKQKGGFSSMLLGTLGTSLLGNLLIGKEIVRAGSEKKKEKELLELVQENNRIFNATSSSFNKF